MTDKANAGPAPGHRPGRITARLLVAGASALLVLFVAGPLLRLLFAARPATLGAALRDPEVHASILLTIGAAGAATALGLLGGVPLAWLLARRRFPGRALVEAVLDLPVVVPHPVAGIALLLFLGRESAVGGALARAGLPPPCQSLGAALVDQATGAGISLAEDLLGAAGLVTALGADVQVGGGPH